MTDTKELDTELDAVLSVHDWVALLMSAHLHKRENYEEGSYLHEETERIVNEIGAQTGITKDDLEAYREKLRDDPNVPYEGEAWER